jgi:hypothetical protein
MAREMDARETSFYQAGHAVARCLLNRPFARVRVSDGLVGTEEFDSDRFLPERDAVDHEIACRLAGYAALLVLTGSHERAEEAAGQDKEWALQWQSLVLTHGGRTDIAGYLEYAIAVAVKTLAGRWAVVETVAAALQERGELTRAHVQDILDAKSMS